MPDIKQLLHGARLIGVGNAWRSIASAYRRDRLEARFPEPVDETIRRAPGRLLFAHLSTSGAVFSFEGDELSVRFLAPDLAFIAWAGAATAPSYAITRFDWPPVDTQL